MDVPALAAFIAATKENDYGIAIFAKVNPVTGAKKEAQFIYTSPNRFEITIMALLQPQ